MLAIFWKGVLNGLVEDMSWFGRRGMMFPLSLRQPRISWAQTAYMATDFVIFFFSIMKRFFGDAGNTLFAIWNLEDVSLTLSISGVNPLRTCPC